VVPVAKHDSVTRAAAPSPLSSAGLLPRWCRPHYAS
jgi:hypothetical protein